MADVDSVVGDYHVITDPSKESKDGGSAPSAAEHDASATGAQSPVAAQDGIPEQAGIVVKMVAPSICKSTTDRNRLFSCSVEPRTLTLTAPTEAGPYRTRVTFKTLGDCTTQFPFIARFSADKLDPVRIQFLVNDVDFLRTTDHSVIESLSIENGSGYAGKESYDGSCRAWFVVEPNLSFDE